METDHTSLVMHLTYFFLVDSFQIFDCVSQLFHVFVRFDCTVQLKNELQSCDNKEKAKPKLFSNPKCHQNLYDEPGNVDKGAHMNHMLIQMRDIVVSILFIEVCKVFDSRFDKTHRN